MSSLSIYTCHHKPSAFLQSNIIHPIHVGKTLAISEICCSGDDTGDNISLKNPFYCELTAQYWVWKNTDLPDYIGFMHYRRHFNFSDNQNYIEDNWGVINIPEINSDYEKQYGLDEESIRRCIDGYDLIVPNKWSVKSAGSQNNYHHYKVSEHLHIDNYQNAIDILLRLYPDYYLAVNEFNDAHDGYYTNMFIMKRDLFVEYSEWLFNILSALESELSFNNYSAQEKRVFGHISERLLNIFVLYKIQTESLKIKELQRTFIQRENFNSYITPAFDKNTIPVVACSDDNYAMSLGALLNSIIRNSSENNNYDIVILDTKISKRNKERLINLVAGRENFSIRFFDIGVFDELKDVHIRAPFTIATYSRLFIPKLFLHHEKVLFIDADTVVESDIAELMNLELGNDLVAAVKDIVMEGFVKFGAIAHSDTGDQPAFEYLKTKLNMAIPDQYFQAGIIVFNVAQMNREDIFEKFINELKGPSFWFLDQDIMNKVLFGRVMFIPLEWNVYHGNGHVEAFYSNLKFSTYIRYLQARQNPKMIHFAGENKPWKTDQVDFYDNFIKNIQGTPWQKEVYECLIVKTNRQNCSSKSDLPALLKTKTKNKLMYCLNKFAPRGTKRRHYIVRVYYKIRRTFLG